MQLNIAVLDLLDYIPPQIKNKKLLISGNGDKVEIKITCRGHSNTLALSRFLPMNEKNLMAFGFAEAEMGKSPRIDYFGVVNSEGYPLLLFKKFAERYFSIHPENWKVYVVYSRPKRAPVEIECRIKKWWSQKLVVGEENVYVDWQKSKREGVLLGSARLYLYNKDLKEIFLEILRKLKKTIKSNPEFVLGYLKGKELGDGTVVLRTRGSIHNFGMTSSNLDELWEDKELYQLIGIPLSDPKFRVIRTGSLENVIIAVRDGHFRGSLIRRLKLLNGFLVALEVRTAYKYLKILSEAEASLDINEIADKAKVVRQAAHYFLQKAMALKWVKREFTRRKFVYSTTKKGLQVVNLVEKATKEKVENEDLYKREQREKTVFQGVNQWK